MCMLKINQPFKLTIEENYKTKDENVDMFIKYLALPTLCTLKNMIVFLANTKDSMHFRL